MTTTIRTLEPTVYGVARYRRVPGRVHASAQVNLECDAAFAGSGASGGIRSEVPDAVGLTAVIIEEGRLKSSGDFNQFDLAPPLQSRSEAGDSIIKLPMQPLWTNLVSAYVTCRCCIATHGNRGMVSPDGMDWLIAGPSARDGSLIPASIGANPQLSVSGRINKLPNHVAMRLTGRDATLLT